MTEIFVSTVPVPVADEAERLRVALGYPSLAAFARDGLELKIRHAQKILADRNRRAARRTPRTRPRKREKASR